MLLNKKGMTLVELIVSIALLSIVVGFLFKIILDVKYEADDAGFAVENQVNRAEIIKVIQKDIIEENVDFYNLKDSLIVSSDGKKLRYDDKSWSIKDEYYKYGDISAEELVDSNYFKVTIPVIDIHGENNSSVDDIILFGELK